MLCIQFGPNFRHLVVHGVQFLEDVLLFFHGVDLVFEYDFVVRASRTCKQRYMGDFMDVDI